MIGTYLFRATRAAATKGPWLNTQRSLACNIEGRTPAPSVDVYPDSLTAIQESFEKYKPGQNKHLPLFVTDCGVVERQYERWNRNLPRVRPFYAVKCNPAKPILQQLAANNAGFDCATAAEIESVLEFGVNPKDIIFANPIKTFADIDYARSVGVKRMTFDNVDEMHKIQMLFPEAELVLRLLPDDSGSLMRFGEKFGADYSQCAELMDKSIELGLKIAGVSFHIGSGCFDPHKYEGAISLARSVFDLAQSKGLPRLEILDIGGGFPGEPEPNATGRDGVPAFEKFAEVIEESVDKHFPQTVFPDLSVISEPGRYFATAAGTLFTMVQGKRKMTESTGDDFLYYINDGVYGSFNSIIFDHAHPNARPINEVFVQQHVHQSPQQQQQPLQYAGAHGYTTKVEVNKSKCTIWGPTCDSMDKVVEGYPMREMNIGEWIVFDHMGAYTTAAASTFNGVPRPIMADVRSLK